MSTNNKERLSYLLRQYASGQTTEQEMAELSGFLEMNKYEYDIKDVLEEISYESEPIENYDEHQVDRMIDRILKHDTGKVKVIPIGRRPMLPKIAAAAVILFAIAGAYFFFINPSMKKSELAQTYSTFKNDIAPGSNKAVLTLGDGSIIVLDSVANGKLAQQGNTQVLKIDSGELSYQATNNNAHTVLQYNTISTPRGGQYQVVLPDGSKVWLDAASSLKFPTAFSGKDRSVELTGEGYFEIAHNSNKPFKVVVNGVEVQDLGTHFNINAYEDEGSIKATLLEGSIRVTTTGKIPQSKVLIPGQQARIEGDKMIEVTSNIDINQVIAWQKGLFEFDNADLPTIMRQISRWYDVQIVYERKPGDEKFGGGISKNLPLSNVLKLMEENGVKFNLEGKVLKVIP